MADTRRDILETVENEDQDRDYTITHTTEEFTFLYPLTRQPCFATIEVAYRPRKSCIEMMSLKRFLNTFRDETYYFETITNRLLDALSEAVKPKRMTVTGQQRNAGVAFSLHFCQQRVLGNRC